MGKWDAGVATPDHTPRGRGFAEALVSFEHMTDRWTQRVFPGGTACTLLDPTIVDLWDGDAPAVGLNGTGFSEDLHLARVLRALAGAAEPGAPPLLLYYAPHVAHYPLQVPKAYLDKFAFMGDDEGACNATVPYVYPGADPAQPLRCRAMEAALMALLDDAVGSAADALKASGLWAETLMLFASDNGAPLDVQESGGKCVAWRRFFSARPTRFFPARARPAPLNARSPSVFSNWPLRGGKYASWEGGVRVPAFVSGGFLPPSRRGAEEPGPIHIVRAPSFFPARARR